MTLDELRVLSEAATPGPWVVIRDDGWRPDEVTRIEGRDSASVVESDGAYCEELLSPCQPRDAAFIVAAVNYVRGLVAVKEVGR